MKKSLLIALLMGMGVSKANAEKISATVPDDGGTIEQSELDTLLSAWKGEQRSLYENDADIVKKIKDAEKSRHLSEIERKLKQTFGLTTEEIEGKKFDEILTIAKAKIGAGTDKTSTELQARILELENEVKNYADVEIPKIKGETEVYKKNFDKKIKLRSLIPSDKEKIRLPFETLERLINMDLEESFDTDLDDKGNFVMKTKGTDLIAKSADGTKFLTMEEFINSRAEHHGALVKSNGGAGDGRDPNKKYGADGKEIIIDAGEGQKRKSPALLKAEAHQKTLEAEKVTVKA